MGELTHSFSFKKLIVTVYSQKLTHFFRDASSAPKKVTNHAQTILCNKQLYNNSGKPNNVAKTPLVNLDKESSKEFANLLTVIDRSCI